MDLAYQENARSLQKVAFDPEIELESSNSADFKWSAIDSPVRAYSLNGRDHRF